MSALLVASCTLESACHFPSTVRPSHGTVRPAADLVVHCVGRKSARMHAACVTTSQRGPASRSTFETLPVEVVNQILSYLTHPRSRLPGLTEAQSAIEFSPSARTIIKRGEDLTTPADKDRWAVNLFNNHRNQHPFHALSLTSKRCNALVESYCGHLVRACNLFNLPFAQLDRYGPNSVWPDMSCIVYRRLWLQHAPRKCIYCDAVMDCYPFPILKRLLTNCRNCFYRQTLTLDEIERQYHISPEIILRHLYIRGQRNSVWFLRVDVETFALQLYGTRAFHNAHKEQFDKPCSICAITSFAVNYGGTKYKPGEVIDLRLSTTQRKKLKVSPRA